MFLCGLGCRVSGFLGGFQFWVQGLGFRVLRFRAFGGFSVWGLGFGVSSFGLGYPNRGLREATTMSCHCDEDDADHCDSDYDCDDSSCLKKP